MSQVELEQVTVAMILAKPERIADAFAMGLDASRHFTMRELGDVYAAALSVWASGASIELMAVCRIVGATRMTELQELRRQAPPTQNFEPYVQALIDAVRSYEVMARLAQISHRLTHRKPMDPLAPMLDELAMAAALGGEQAAVRTVPLRKAIDESIEAIEKKIEGHRGIPTGIPALDNDIYGWRAPFVYAIGARTGVGKTTLALNFAVNAARGGYRTAYFTVEMHAADLADKIIAESSRVNLSRLLNGSLIDDELDRISHAAPRSAELPLDIVEMREPELSRLEAEAARQVKLLGTKLLVIDYLQLFDIEDGEQRRSFEEVKQISKRIKGLATRLNVPVIVLSQLNRQAPEFDQPNETHIAGSDQIGRDADVILLLWRNEDSEYTLTINKQRRGRRGSIALDARLEHSYFGTRV